MILEKQIDNLVLSEGESDESTKMSLDLESADFLMGMLSKNIYQAPISSLVREYSSNALDSHRRHGTEDPVIVSLKLDSRNNWEFSVEDFGIGLSKEEFLSIMTKYGKSTKRQSINELGCFGIGSKSGLAYSSSVYFICRKDGKESKFMMYEGEDRNTIDLIHEEDTAEKNGVKVIVPVKYGDKYNFITDIKEQLAYFQGVYFKVEGISNDFKIHRSEHFQWSELCTDSDLHICLDDVYYPIDFQKLGIDRIQVPVGLRFSLTDGIQPTINRESIRYTAESKAIILSKIKHVAEYFVNRYNEFVGETDDIEKVFDHYRYSYKSVKGFKEGSIIKIDGLLKYTSLKPVKPTLKGVSKIDLQRVYHMKDSLFSEYTTKYVYYNGRFTGSGNDTWKKRFDYDRMNRTKTIYTFSNDLPVKLRNYLRDEVLDNRQDILFIQKDKTTRLNYPKWNGWARTANEGYWDTLNLSKYPKNEWREVIKEFQYIQSLYTSKFKNVDEIVIPQEYFEKKKAQRVQVLETKTRRIKLIGEITTKMASRLERYVSGKNCKFEPAIFKSEELYKDKKLTIYCENTAENESIIQKWFNIVDRKTIRFVTLSNRELNKIKDLNVHNWIKMEDFLKGKHIAFRRIVTAYLIDGLKDKYSATFNKKLNYIGNISTPLYKDLLSLEEYREKYFVSRDNEVLDECVKLAEDQKLFDYSVYHIYKSVKFTLERLPFIETILDYAKWEADEELVKALRDLFKYYKQRIDWKHYKLTINDEEVEESEVKTIEELENQIL